ncbi:MAG: TatD family nuclease-associated radical SAM protein [Thermovenabulum sp.]|uniref:TatD family nuclease-associated radical SAM protein n=1 Tax=Thermovenabulum sp. TaxID=3100335 RepID=UPI003C7AE883
MIAYKIGDSLYLNITNRCPNKCSFCIRNFAKGVGGYDLWLEREPTTKEIIEAIKEPEKYKEIVFCGYGEPLLRLQVVLDVASYIKNNYPGIPIRINTNGLGNLIHGEDITLQFKGLIDVVSISLNADNAEKYDKICRSDYGEEAFYAVLEFARKCKNYVPKVILTVVELPEIDIEKCRKIAEELGVGFRVRKFEKG